ncbi:MAG: PKD domain-containing protein [Limisphaerales bacterium]
MQTIYVSFILAAAALAPAESAPLMSDQRPSQIEPLFRTIDLNVGESGQVTLSNGKGVSVKLVELRENCCEMRGAVRRAELVVEVAGQRGKLAAATYNLPQTIGVAQIDCPVTRGYVLGGSDGNIWALDKDARLRLWPAGSPWSPPGKFGYPVNQRWFASDTHMANDPCYVDGSDVPGKKPVYYHYGLDFGGAEGMVDVLAATDGTIVCRGDARLPGYDYPPQVKPRYDVLYLRDSSGWFYRYSHLQSFDASVKLGGQATRGAKLGTLGKEGGSGGWSHLHWDITMPQPSGRYGIADGYAFMFQAYLERCHPQLVAVARPHQVAWCGEPVTLDASRSWHAPGGRILRYDWQLGDGTTASGPTLVRYYPRPGHYAEVVKVADDHGRSDLDVAVVEVFNREAPLPRPPSIHAACWPTLGLKPGDEITFKVRTFGVRPDEGEELWNFGDGTAVVRTRSDGNANQHAPDGYAITTHHFDRPGEYIISVCRANARGETATARLHLQVGAMEPNSRD